MVLQVHQGENVQPQHDFLLYLNACPHREHTTLTVYGQLDGHPSCLWYRSSSHTPHKHKVQCLCGSSQNIPNSFLNCVFLCGHSSDLCLQLQNTCCIPCHRCFQLLCLHVMLLWTPTSEHMVAYNKQHFQFCVGNQVLL